MAAPDHAQQPALKIFLASVGASTHVREALLPGSARRAANGLVAAPSWYRGRFRR